MANIKDEKNQYGLHWRLRDNEKTILALEQENEEIRRKLGLYK